MSHLSAFDDLGTRSRFSRRRFLSTSTLAAGGLLGAEALLSSCGSSTQNGSGGSSATTTITVMYQANEMSKEQIALFEKTNPTIKVKFVEFDPLRLTSSLAAGNPPDFVRTFGAPEMPNIIARGLALNLDKYFAKSTVIKQDDLQDINNVYRYDGHAFGTGSRYGMAKDFSQDVMIWYNKKLFDQAHVPYPSSTQPMTYDELLDVGKRLVVRQDNKINVYGLNPQWGGNVQGILIQGARQQGTELYNSDLTQVALTTPEVRRIAQWYVNWAQAHVGISPLDPEANWDGTLFPANRLAMTTFGFWFGGFINPDPGHVGDHSGLAPTPLFGSRPVSACMTGTGAWIPKASKNPDAAWAFMEFFMAGQPAHDRAKSGFGLPALKSLMSEVPQDTAAEKQFYQVQSAELQNFSILKFSPYITDSAFTTAYTKAMEPVMKGQNTLDAALKQAEDTINLLLQQGKSQIG